MMEICGKASGHFASSLSDLCLLLRIVPDFAGILVEKTSNNAAILSFSPENPVLPDDFLVAKSSVRQTAMDVF